MHALFPPMNDILRDTSVRPRLHRRSNEAAHRLEYTPGTWAAVNWAGRGFSQRSGFHSYASSPHSALLVLHPSMPTMTCVPLGMAISSILVPSVP